MNKFLNYIKNNISVFSSFSLILIVVSLFKIIVIDTTHARHINSRLIYYFVIVFALVILLFDYVFKKNIFRER